MLLTKVVQLVLNQEELKIGKYFFTKKYIDKIINFN